MKPLQVSISDKQILSRALPISFAIFVPQLNFFVNNIFLSGLGERELGLAGITGTYYLIFAVIGMGLSNGLLVLLSRSAGENNKEEIGNLFHEGLRIALTIAILGIICTYFLAPLILGLSLKDSFHAQMVKEFLEIRIWGLPCLYLYQLRNSVLVATNNTRFLVIATLIETLTNIFFDYALIYGKFGFPEFGFNGAAVSSIIAECLGLLTVYLVAHKQGINTEFELLKKRANNPEKRKLILWQSAPLIIQNAIACSTWEFFYILVEHRGALDLAVSNGMRNIYGLFGCFNWAFASTANSMISNIIGQGKQGEVFSLVWKIIKWTAGLSLCICLILNLIPEQVLGIYRQGEEFMTLGIPTLRVVSLALVLTSFGTIWMNALIGTGRSMVVLYIEVLTALLYSIYVYVILELTTLPISWAWASEWLYWIIIFAGSFVCMIWDRSYRFHKT